MLSDTVLLSRWQFAVTTSFHMLWPLLSVGLSLWLVVLELLAFRTRQEVYARHVRFWTTPFLMSFAVGVVSGLPLEFQFGTNWAPFAGQPGASSAIFSRWKGHGLHAGSGLFDHHAVRLEAGRAERPHFVSTIPGALAASFSCAFWIMAANSWMQTPAGG